MAGPTDKHGVAVVKADQLGRLKPAISYYDFAVDGGAIGSLPLRGDSIPLNAIIVDVEVIVETIVASGGAATLGITGEGAGDLQAAVVVSGAPWSTATPKNGTQTHASAPIKATAVRVPTAVIGAFALTAGKFKVVTWYYEYA